MIPDTIYMIPPKPVTRNKRKKVEKYLSKGEEPTVVTSIGNRYFWLQVLISLPFAFLLIGIPKLGKTIRMKQSHTYVLTNRRFIIITGIFSRKIVTAPLTAITHITVDQSVLQRFVYNTGNLIIITAGFDQTEIVVDNIENPVYIKVLIEDLTRRIENKRDLENVEIRQL